MASVHVLGVRHHGPGSARSVAAALAELRPDAVLIEGPADAGPLLKLAAAEGMTPPVALLAYAVDNPAHSAFWPFAVFSPEWQALTWALANEVEVRFCDLPAATVLAPARVSPKPPAREQPDDEGPGGEGPGREELEGTEGADVLDLDEELRDGHYADSSAVR